MIGTAIYGKADARSDFVDWIENTIHLPLGLSADPWANHVAGLFVENRGHQGGSLGEQRQIAISESPRLLRRHYQ